MRHFRGVHFALRILRKVRKVCKVRNLKCHFSQSVEPSPNDFKFWSHLLFIMRNSNLQSEFHLDFIWLYRSLLSIRLANCCQQQTMLIESGSQHTAIAVYFSMCNFSVQLLITRIAYFKPGTAIGYIILVQAQVNEP